MLAREPGKAQGGRDRLLEAKKSQRDVDQQERLSACSLAGFLGLERPSIPLRMCWRLAIFGRLHPGAAGGTCSV